MPKIIRFGLDVSMRWPCCLDHSVGLYNIMCLVWAWQAINRRSRSVYRRPNHVIKLLGNSSTTATMALAVSTNWSDRITARKFHFPGFGKVHFQRNTRYVKLDTSRIYIPIRWYTHTHIFIWFRPHAGPQTQEHPKTHAITTQDIKTHTHTHTHTHTTQTLFFIVVHA